MATTCGLTYVSTVGVSWSQDAISWISSCTASVMVRVNGTSSWMECTSSVLLPIRYGVKLPERAGHDAGSAGRK
jgi:hypothetical protein